MVFAIALAVVALVLTARLRTTLILDSKSITIIKGRHRRVLDWSMIDSVRLQGPRLKLITKPQGGADATVLNPRSAADASVHCACRRYRQASRRRPRLPTTSIRTVGVFPQPSTDQQLSGRAERSQRSWGRTRTRR